MMENAQRLLKVLKMEMTYEEQIEELKGIIEKIEKREAGLEESLILYKRGMDILRNCEKYLEDAELKVTELQDSGMQ